VAAITRTLTMIVSLLPTFSNSFSCRTRSIFAWSAGSISPISSKKMLPPSAFSNLPVRSAAAPVNAPRTWPNSSLSRRGAGIAAQFTATKSPSRRALFSWIERARSSFPVPVSPKSSTEASVGATRSIREWIARILPLAPTISGAARARTSSSLR